MHGLPMSRWLRPPPGNKKPWSICFFAKSGSQSFCWSGWAPHARFPWWLEIAPGLAGLAILLATYRRFQFTTFSYALIALHICVLCVGGHYTYARVPVFDWLRPIFGWHRNHYDRLGHLMQGFVPAIIAREVILRLNVLTRKNWLPFLVISICLVISQFYELIECWTALAIGGAADDFLGTRGPVWAAPPGSVQSPRGAARAARKMNIGGAPGAGPFPRSASRRRTLGRRRSSPSSQRANTPRSCAG